MAKMSNEWRWSTMVPLNRNNQNCNNYMNIKMLSHTMKIETLVEMEGEDKSIHFWKSSWIHAKTIDYWSHPSCAETGGEILEKKEGPTYNIHWSWKLLWQNSKDVLWRCLGDEGVSIVYVRAIKEYVWWSLDLG